MKLNNIDLLLNKYQKPFENVDKEWIQKPVSDFNSKRIKRNGFAVLSEDDVSFFLAVIEFPL